jgi:hypothetical protein
VPLSEYLGTGAQPQRRGVGEVIQHTGHKVFDLATDEPLELHGPDMADDPDFCAAVVP